MVSNQITEDRWEEFSGETEWDKFERELDQAEYEYQLWCEWMAEQEQDTDE